MSTTKTLDQPFWELRVDGNGVKRAYLVFEGAACAPNGVEKWTTDANGSIAGLPSVTVSDPAIATTSTDGVVLQNTTASTASVTQQYSPRARFTGTAWNSVGSASETDSFAVELRTITQAGATKTRLYFMSSIAGGAYADKGYINSDGAIVAAQSVNVLASNGEIVTGNAGFIYWLSRAIMSSPADAKILLQNFAQNAGVTLDFSTNGIVLFKDFAGTSNAQIAGASVRGAAVTVSNLPSSPVEGMVVAVTDATATTAGSIVAGGSSHHCLVYYNGTNWIIVVGT